MTHTSVLIIGESGAGKSTSIRTLDPKETFIINTINKPLPFKTATKNYRTLSSKDDLEGNMLGTDRAASIIRVINAIDKERPHIKNLILDDFQYVMANEFMRRALEKGYEKFSEIGQNAWSIINALNSCRDDLTTIVLSHSETNDMTGKVKCKTIGKMVDDKVCLEGMFTIVLQSAVIDGKHVFITQHDGMSVAKSPLGMFEEKLIPNDLQFVINAIKNY